jgi:hypothetical protein
LVKELGYSIPEDPEGFSPALEKIRPELQARLQSGLSPEVQTELESLRTVARSVGVLADENFTRDYVNPVNAAYADVIREMSEYFDADPAQIKSDFTDPLLESGKFNPGNLPPDWWDSQVELMSKAPPVVKRKVQEKIANVLLLQERHDNAARELAGNQGSFEKYKQQSQQRLAKNWESAIRGEAVKALGEPGFEEWADLRKRADEGDADAKAEVAKAEEELGKIFSDLNTMPGSAIRRGLKVLSLQKQAAKAAALEADLKEANREIKRLKGNVVQNRKAKDAPFSGGHGSGPAKPAAPGLPVDGRKSLDETFRNWKL